MLIKKDNNFIFQKVHVGLKQVAIERREIKEDRMRNYFGQYSMVYFCKNFGQYLSIINIFLRQ